MLATACAAEGYRSTANCPLILRLHGGCGGSRLMLASGLRAQVRWRRAYLAEAAHVARHQRLATHARVADCGAKHTHSRLVSRPWTNHRVPSYLQGNVVRIEAWWEGGRQASQPRPSAGGAGGQASGPLHGRDLRRLLSQPPQQQQEIREGQGEQQSQKQSEQQQEEERQRQQAALEEPPPVNFLPHAQMPNFREPAETVLTAIRVTFARGLTQVRLMGCNASAAAMTLCQRSSVRPGAAR